MDSNSYYRKIVGFRTAFSGRLADVITITSTPQSTAGDSLQADNCIHCHAAWGHKIVCPLLNRNIAEARSAVLNKPDADWLKAQHITW